MVKQDLADSRKVETTVTSALVIMNSATFLPCPVIQLWWRPPILQPSRFIVVRRSRSRRHSSWLQCVRLFTYALAEARRPLIYGGGNRGIMGVVSGVATDEGGCLPFTLPCVVD